MTTYSVQPEPSTLTVKPGGFIRYPNPLNQGDVISLTVDWAPWLGSDTISSVAWDAESGVSVSGTSNDTTTASATITAAATGLGWRKVEQVITTANSNKRTVVVEFEVQNLR